MQISIRYNETKNSNRTSSCVLEQKAQDIVKNSMGTYVFNCFENWSWEEK